MLFTKKLNLLELKEPKNASSTLPLLVDSFASEMVEVLNEVIIGKGGV